MSNKNPEEEAELTLKSLDNIQKVKAPNGFMDEVSSKILFVDRSFWTTRVKYAVAAMIAITILNTLLLINLNNYKRDQMIESVVVEWRLGD